MKPESKIAAQRVLVVAFVAVLLICCGLLVSLSRPIAFQFGNYWLIAGIAHEDGFPIAPAGEGIHRYDDSLWLIRVRGHTYLCGAYRE